MQVRLSHHLAANDAGNRLETSLDALYVDICDVWRYAALAGRGAALGFTKCATGRDHQGLASAPCPCMATNPVSE